MGDSNNSGSGGGQSLGGNGGGESLPLNWARSSNSGQRIGRIGNWGGGNDSPSRSSSSGGARIGTLRDMGSSSGSRDDSDDEKPENRETWFAGGERSGINVQNPDRAKQSKATADILKDLLKQAQENGRAGNPSGSGSNTSFRGSGMTLGGEGTESREVKDPNAPSEELELVERRVTLWRTGFTIDDGPLRNYTDPENEALLRQLRAGQAPLEPLGIRFGQRVDIKIDERLREEYVAPKVVAQPFGGSGQRLGAPAPIPAPAAAASSSTMPGAFQGSSSGDATASGPERNLEAFDSAQTIFELSDGPRTRITIRFADGSREVVTMNLTHTISDIRNFINFSRRESNTREYTITATNTFPPRVLTDETQTIQDAKLERSVVMQKWV